VSLETRAENNRDPPDEVPRAALTDTVSDPQPHSSPQPRFLGPRNLLPLRIQFGIGVLRAAGNDPGMGRKVQITS
jgi:hypothetical protein